MLSAGLAGCMLNTFSPCLDVCARAPPFVPWLLVLYRHDSLFGLLLLDHAHLQKTAALLIGTLLAAQSLQSWKREMQSVNLICTEAELFVFECVRMSLPARWLQGCTSLQYHPADHCRGRFMIQPACNRWWFSSFFRGWNRRNFSAFSTSRSVPFSSAPPRCSVSCPFFSKKMKHWLNIWPAKRLPVLVY